MAHETSQNIRGTIKQSVGIDCDKDSLVCELVNEDELGNITSLSCKTVKNRESGFKELLKWVRKLRHGETVLSMVMEATGVYHESAAVFLHSNGMDVKVVLPNKAMHFQKTITLKTVTDKVSASSLAVMGIEKKLDNWNPPHPVFNELKQYSRERNQLLEEQTIIKNQKHAEEHSAWTNAKTIKRYDARLNFIAKQLESIEEDMRQVVGKEKWLQLKMQNICSIPGIGFITAISIVSETDGFNLIRNKKQITSYAGLDPMKKESGTSVKSKERISYKGNRNLRKAMHFPALVAIRKESEHKQLFIRLVKKHGIKMKAAVAVQRKLLELTYILWKRDEKYNPNYHQQKVLKNKGQQENPAAPNELVHDRS